MKRFIFIMIASLLFLGGCQVDTYPEVPAFEDEFTREFLPSTEEVEDGYFLFESKTGGYEMLFSQNFKAYQVQYERQGDEFERIVFGEFDRDTNRSVKHRVTYDYLGTENLRSNLETMLNLLSNSIDYNGKFEKIETENYYLHFAQKTEKYEREGLIENVYRTFSYIYPKEGGYGLEYLITAYCYDESKSCSISEEEQLEQGLKIMKSVKFK